GAAVPAPPARLEPGWRGAADLPRAPGPVVESGARALPGRRAHRHAPVRILPAGTSGARGRDRALAGAGVALADHGPAPGLDPAATGAGLRRRWPRGCRDPARGR